MSFARVKGVSVKTASPEPSVLDVTKHDNADELTRNICVSFVLVINQTPITLGLRTLQTVIFLLSLNLYFIDSAASKLIHH